MSEKKELGDLVESIAHPIAKAMHIDPDCGGCKRRKEILNNASRAARRSVGRLFKRR